MPDPYRFTREQIGEICAAQRFTPDLLVSAMVSALRQYYGSRERVGDMPGGGGSILWSEDPGERTIAIEPKFNWKSDDDSHVPGIFPGLGGIAPAGEARTLRMGEPNPSTFCGTCPETGDRVYRAYRNVSASILCLAREYLSCWALAYDVQTFAETYMGLVIDKIGMSHMSQPSASEPQPYQKRDGVFAAYVSFTAVAIDAWVLEKEGLPATSLEINLSSTI